MLKKIKVEDAVGLRLAHDHTQIRPGKFKGVGFRRGHVVRPNDIPKLLDLGKKQVFVLKLEPGEVHEEEAARRMAKAVAGRGIKLRGPREGKVDFVSRSRGLLKVKSRPLARINGLGFAVLATLHNHAVVGADQVVAGTRIIPLLTRESRVRRVEEIGRKEGPVLEVLPLRSKKVGVVVTGSEIFEGRIQDRSAAIVRGKVEALGSRMIGQAVVPDDPLRIGREIRRLRAKGCQVIVTTGGLSVDPDDLTLEGIRASGAEVIFYGAAVLPGSMSAYARLGKTIILGAPACVVHDPVTALDLFLPRVFADDPILPEEIAGLGHGGLCLRCEVCRYPVCPFGKGG